MRQAQYTFVVGSPDWVETRVPGEARAVADPSPARKHCRREDFEDFDAFVECRVAEQGNPPAPVVAPPVDHATRARQREAAEARAELGRKAREQAASEAEEDLRVRRMLLALAISGGVLDATGIGLVAAAAATGESVAGPPDDGPICTVGKRCGDTCVAVELTCHTPTTGGSFKANPALLWSGIAALAVGSGLLATALVMYRRNNPRTSLIVTARGVGFRF